MTRPIRFDPESIMASPEKAELVEAVRLAYVQQHIERRQSLIGDSSLTDGQLEMLLVDWEAGSIEEPDDRHMGRHVKLLPAERAQFKQLVILAIEARGGRYQDDGRQIWVVERGTLRRMMA